jgi:hypothetical protein
MAITAREHGRSKTSTGEHGAETGKTAVSEGDAGVRLLIAVRASAGVQMTGKVS